jgi:hypothetical protein
MWLRGDAAAGTVACSRPYAGVAKLDANKDGKLSTGDVKSVVKAHGEQIQAEWTDGLIDSTLEVASQRPEPWSPPIL